MKRVLPLLLLFFVSVPASAGEFTNISRPLPVLLDQLGKEPPAAVPSAAAAENRTTSGGTALYWNHLYRELFLQGSATFEYKKQLYAIKPMFTKGAYDMEREVYAAEPWFYILNVTDVDNKAPLEATVHILAEGEMTVSASSGDTFKVKAGGGAITILSQGGFSEKKVFSASHDQLLNLWAENAENYKRTVHGKVIYLVPQMIRDQENKAHVGFVASEGKPLAAATKRPMDFIALCKAVNNIPCRPMRYSIPLGLKFRYLGKPDTGTDEGYFYWEIEEMVNEDLYDALDDEARELAVFA